MAAADASLMRGSGVGETISTCGAGRVWIGTLLQPRNGCRVSGSWTPRGVECEAVGRGLMARAEEWDGGIRGEADTGATVGRGGSVIIGSVIIGSVIITVGLAVGRMCSGTGF